MLFNFPFEVYVEIKGEWQQAVGLTDDGMVRMKKETGDGTGEYYFAQWFEILQNNFYWPPAGKIFQ